MASQKSTGSKSDFKDAKPARASAAAPQTPAEFRPPMAATTMVPKPPQSGAHAPKPDRTAKTDIAEDGGVPLKKQELLAKVVERSDVSKKHVKPVIEAMLAVLGEAIAEGRELNLQPLGKVKRKRMKDTGKARVIVASIRQQNATETGAGSTVGAAPVKAAVQRAQSGKGQADSHKKEAVADTAEGR